jgi:LysM repeat protein
MGYWGWRRIFAFFVSVLVVGCSTTYESAPTIPPTALPPVTLIARGLITPTPPATPTIPPATPRPAATALVYTVQQGDTLLALAAQFGIAYRDLQAANSQLDPLRLPIGAAIIIPNPHFDAAGVPVLPTATPVPLVVLPPICRPTATEGIICLGRVLNTRASGVERVNIVLQLLRQNGGLLAEGSAGIEQAFIPAGGSAPYRALFKAEWHDYSSAVAWLQSAEQSLDENARYVVLDIQNQQAQWLDGQYTVSAIVHNPDTQSARLTQAVLTVEDASGQIAAYRVLPLTGEIAAGANVPLQISVMADVPMTHTLYVEAERAP